MKINHFLILTFFAAVTMLQASQVEHKIASEAQRQATSLERRMIRDAGNGTLTQAKLKQYLNDGADINAKSELGFTALILAAFNGHTDIVQQLIAAGAHINAKNNDGNTALIEAAASGRTAIVQQLIAAGADDTIRNDRNKTARDYVEDKDAYDKAVDAGLAERKRYLAQQAKVKSVIEEELGKPQQKLSDITKIVAEYAYGPSPSDLPEVKQPSSHCVIQ